MVLHQPGMLIFQKAHNYQNFKQVIMGVRFAFALALAAKHLDTITDTNVRQEQV